MKKLNSKGFGAVEAILIVIIVGLIAGVGYYVYNQSQKQDETSQPQSSTTTIPPTTEKQEDVDYGKLSIKETGVSLELSKDIEDAYYLADDAGGVSFGVKSLDSVSGCKAKYVDVAGGTLTGVAVLHYGGGGGTEEYQSFKSNPNSSQVADKFFFVIDADESCESSDAATQKKIDTVKAAFEKAGKTIEIKDFSSSYYGRY